MASKRGVQRRPPLFSYPALPEIRLCWIVVVATIAYGWTRVYQVSQEFDWQIGHLASVKQLPLVGERYKDENDWEWFRWSPHALGLLPVLAGHSLLFNLGSAFLPEGIFVPLYTLSSLAVCAWKFSPLLVLYALLQGLVIFFSSYLYPRRLTVWLSSLPILYYVMHNTETLHKDVFFVLLFIAYTLLSSISFCLETLSGPLRPQDAPIHKRLLRMFFYTFYQPYIVSLIILYPDFERQIEEKKTRKRDWHGTLVDGLRVAFWWGVTDLLLHYCYFASMLRDLDFAAEVSKDAFVALGMALGQFFHLKYVVIFGLPSFFAKLDNMQPLEGPICLARVCLYSKVWRCFDRGLYNFFKKYIFVPFCEPDFTISKKIVGVFLSYGFVLVWHGFHHNNIVWILLNIAALFMEMGSKAFYSIEGVRLWREKNISDVNLRRILGLLQIIPFAFGLYSNFYFLGGSEVGAMFVKRVLEEETIPVRKFFLVLITIGWFYTQTTMEADRWEELREAKKEKAKKTN